MTDVFARALRDWYRDEQRGPLRYRDGAESEGHEVAGYFESWSPGEDGEFFRDLSGPVLDMGAGAGRHALYCQEHVQTTAIEPSEALVDVMTDRGVEAARVADMFSLRDAFGPDAFESAYSVGTQAGMAKSVAGLGQFLRDLAHLTTPDASVQFDGYDPRHERTQALIGYREDPAGETAYRFVQYEYDGDLGRPWLFRLFEPADVREATVGTGWDVEAIRRGTEGWEHTSHTHLVKA